MPNTIAIVSTAKIPSSGWRPFRKRNPSRIEDRLGRSTLPSGGIRGSSQTTTKRRRIRDEVDAVRPGDACDRDQDPADSGAADGGERAVDARERGGGGDLAVRDEPRREGAHRRSAEAEDRDRDGLEHEERPDLRVRKQRVDEEEPGDERHPGLGPQQDRPPVERVGDRAADQRHDEQRDERRQAEQPDERGRMRERVDLVRHGDGADLAADRRDRLAEPEVAKVTVAERARVDPHAREEALALVQRVDRHQSSASFSQSR